MAESLIPDFSPEAYSSGQGSGYAQVFNLGAANPFDVTSDTYKNLLAIEKDKLNASYENEKKRQEKLDEFLSSINDYDNAWATGQAQLTKKIDDYGNLIAGMRAKGTNLDLKSLNVSKKEIADLAKANQGNQKKYSEIAAMMADPLIYDDEERGLFQQEVKDAAGKDNGIMEVQSYLDKWKESLATPSLVADYIKIKPEAKSDKTGYIKATDPAEAKRVVVDNVWAGYQPVQKKKLLQDLVQSGLVSQDTVNAAKDDKGAINFENEGLKLEIGDALYDRIEPYLEKDVTPKPVYRGGGGGGTTPESPFTINSQPLPGGNPDYMQTVAISKKGGGSVPPSSFRDKYGTYNMTPDRIVYIDEKNTGYEYVTDQNGKIKKDSSGKPLKQKAAAGWYVVGKIQKEQSIGSKAVNANDTEANVISSFASSNNMNPENVAVKREGDVWKFYKLESKQVPYEDNKALMKNYGVESLEAVAAQSGNYKGIAGGSGGGGGELD